MPAFAYRHIKDLYPVFWSKSRELVDHLSATVKASTEATEQNGSLSHDEEKGGSEEPAHRPDAIEVGDGKWSFNLFIGLALDCTHNSLTSSHSRFKKYTGHHW